MRFKRMISAIDSHTEGEPTRVVIGGVPVIPGETFQARWQWAKENLESLRRLLMYEPRGSSFMSGTIVTAPATPGADVGVIYIEVSGFLPMCGHGTIGTCTVLVEAGLVPVTEPVTMLVLDTPAGLVRAKIDVQDGVALSVTIQNIPSFLYKADQKVVVPELGEVVVDLAYGGNFYAILPAANVGLEIGPGSAKEIIHKGTLIREAILNQVVVQHPTIPAINRCTHVRFIAPTADPRVTRNATFYSTDAIDRSPCGTGTSAEMAARYGKGIQDLNEEIICESFIGSRFYGRLIEKAQVGPYAAVIPTIRGSAYISGIHQVVLDPRDPFPEGIFMGTDSKW